MEGIIDKVRDLFKCKAEKSTKSVPRQEEPKAEEKTEERSRSAEETASDKWAKNLCLFDKLFTEWTAGLREGTGKLFL